MYKNSSVFIAACLGIFLFGISLITLGSVATDLKLKYQLTGTEAGTLFSILPVGILCGSLIFGPVCDRYGYKLLLLSACVAMFAGFEGIAFSQSLFILKISIFIFGLGGGIINGSTNAVVAHITENNKGANLSLLGVFFGIGALGMPLVLAMLSKIFTSLQVVAIVGILTLIVGLFYASIQFPPAKQHELAAKSQVKNLLRPVLLLIALFLFFQSSLEAIINNWTTTYLVTRGVMSESLALYALSIHITGMVAMRLLTGSLLRPVSHILIIWISLALVAIGVLLMLVTGMKGVVFAGLFFSGAGLAGGFPIMLGFVGDRFPSLSGTAFSLVFTVALIGNMLINYLMGIVVDKYGVEHLITASLVQAAIMSILFLLISKRLFHPQK